MCNIERICNRCTHFVADNIAPNAKCQRVFVLAICLVILDLIPITVVLTFIPRRMFHVCCVISIKYEKLVITLKVC